jgi:hypothetical protein
VKVYPYEHLNRPITLRVTAVSLKLDDGTLDRLETSAFSTAERVVALGLAGHDGWTSARIRVSATMPPGADVEGAPWSELCVLVALTDGETNVRTCVELVRDTEDGRDWSGTVELLRDDHAGRASLSAFAAGTVEAVPGRVIAESRDNWVVDTLSDDPVKDIQLKVQKASFKKSAREWLSAYADVPWIVDTSARVPTVFVNTDVDGFLGLLDSVGSGVESKVSELLIAQMATDVWSAVFHSALGDLELDGDDPVFPTDWKGEVLREMLPDVLPGLHVEDALREVHRRRTGESGWAELQTRIHYAAVRRSDTTKALSHAIRRLEQMNRESVTS